MNKISDFLTIGDAAEYLGISADTLRRWDRAGKLKARRHPVSRYRLYITTDLDAFLRSLQTGKTNKRIGSHGRPKRKRTQKQK